MKRFFAAVLASLLLGPTFVYADSVYFEFSPDFVQSLFVTTSPQPVEQLFLPLNDHLSALDVWLSNSGVSGDATFELFGPND